MRSNRDLPGHRKGFAGRGLRAAALGFLVTLVLGGAVGFVQADVGRSDGLGPAPAVFGVPPARAGDRGRYDYAFVDLASGGPTDSIEPYLKFEVLGVSEAPDADGTIRARHDIRIFDYSYGLADPGARGYFRTEIESREPGTGRLLAEQAMFDPALGEDVTYNLTRLFPAEDQYRPGGELCGLANPLQGRHQALAEGVFLLRDCTVRFAQTEGYTFDARGSEYVDERLCVLFQQRHGRGIQVWFCEHIPFPVKFILPWSEERLEVITLSGFERGEGQELPPEAAPSRSLSALVHAPVRPWGPDDSGLVHPFPLSKAYAIAKNDPNETGFRDFLDRHPRAFVEAARFAENERDTERHRIWQWTVTDGLERYHVALAQIERPVSPTDIPPIRNLSPQGRETAYEYREVQIPGFDDLAIPQPEDVPARMPTVASLWARWPAYATERYAGIVPNAWSFQIFSPDAEIGGWSSEDGYGGRMECPPRPPLGPGRTCIMAGYQIYRWPGTSTNIGSTTILPGASWYRDTSMISLDEGGVTRARIEVTRAPASAASPAEPSSSGADPSPLRTAALETKFWEFPAGRYAAGTSAVGILVTIAFWLWPNLKGGLLALFSRISRPEALKNPVRNDMMHLIEAEPGIHFQEIARRLSLSQSSADHHLRKLVDVGLVSAQKGTGYTCYFPKGAVDRCAMAAAEATKAPGAQKVMAAVSARPGSTAGEIAAAANLTPGTVTYHLKRLSDAGLIELERLGNTVRVSPKALTSFS